LFPTNTKYFDPSNASFMINYRVENLDELLESEARESRLMNERKNSTTGDSDGSWIPKAIVLNFGNQVYLRERNAQLINVGSGHQELHPRFLSPPF
jgi:hypothetical protein